MDNKDPLTDFLKEQGVPSEPDVTKPESITVFSFPTKAPKGSKTRKEVTALEQLELYKQYKEHWAEHNVSITVYYRDSEFLDIGAWIYRNFDNFIGISLLPYSDHVYAQAPYQEITETDYQSLASVFPTIDWDALGDFEKGDTTTGSHELACVGGVCEVVGVQG